MQGLKVYYTGLLIVAGVAWLAIKVAGDALIFAQSIGG